MGPWFIQGLILTGTPCQIILSDRKSLSMKNLDQLLAAHIRELERFHFGPKPEVQLSNEEIQKLRYEFEIDASKPAKLGRPFAHRTRNERTFQSFEVFVLVTGEMRIFKFRHDPKGGVPKRIRDKFIEFAKRLSPNADNELVIEHLRKDQRILPYYDEPVAFQVVRHEYTDGTMANVIVCYSAAERLKRCG